MSQSNADALKAAFAAADAGDPTLLVALYDDDMTWAGFTVEGTQRVYTKGEFLEAFGILAKLDEARNVVGAVDIVGDEIVKSDALREAAESVLKDNETLSSLMETAVRELVHRRQVRAEFLRRGIESLEEYRRTGVSYSVEEVFDELEEMLEARRKELQAQLAAIEAEIDELIGPNVTREWITHLDSYETTFDGHLVDAMNEAIRDWVTNVATTHYVLGSAVGPHRW